MGERLEAELSLLEAMYPGEITIDKKAHEIKYGTKESLFRLRLPDGYLSDELPVILSASSKKRDVRQQLQDAVRSLSAGGEVLDTIVSSFNEIVSVSGEEPATDAINDLSEKVVSEQEKHRTVIVWLHHLLNTNKRKQALSPPSTKVSGITKPGYPGVLVYSGGADAVNEHVNELKQLNWQAFQVRFEVEEEWTFTHGTGVKEVESMKEVVAGIPDQEKQRFMKAIMK